METLGVMQPTGWWSILIKDEAPRAPSDSISAQVRMRGDLSVSGGFAAWCAVASRSRASGC